jgi:hypothetical protein
MRGSSGHRERRRRKFFDGRRRRSDSGSGGGLFTVKKENVNGARGEAGAEHGPITAPRHIKGIARPAELIDLLTVTKGERGREGEGRVVPVLHLRATKE